MLEGERCGVGFTICGFIGPAVEACEFFATGTVEEVFADELLPPVRSMTADGWITVTLVTVCCLLAPF